VAIFGPPEAGTKGKARAAEAPTVTEERSDATTPKEIKVETDLLFVAGEAFLTALGGIKMDYSMAVYLGKNTKCVRAGSNVTPHLLAMLSAYKVKGLHRHWPPQRPGELLQDCNTRYRSLWSPCPTSPPRSQGQTYRETYPVRQNQGPCYQSWTRLPYLGDAAGILRVLCVQAHQHLACGFDLLGAHWAPGDLHRGAP
jgi:hypothetical protein